MVKVKTKKCICMRCDYVWKRRKSEVNTCPKCKSPYWNLPKGLLKRGRPVSEPCINLPILRVRDL
jgi:hypothetical protein